MVFAFGGIAVMFAGSLGGGAWLGNLIAVLIPIAFAANVVMLRRMHASVDMVPAVLIAGVVGWVVWLREKKWAPEARLGIAIFAFALIQFVWLCWYFYTGLGGALELTARVMSIALTLQILVGELEPDSGSFRWGVTITHAYFPKENTSYFANDLNLIGIQH